MLPGEWRKESEEASDSECREAARLALRVTGPALTGGYKMCTHTHTHLEGLNEVDEAVTDIRQSSERIVAVYDLPGSGRSRSRSRHRFCDAPPPAWR